MVYFSQISRVDSWGYVIVLSKFVILFIDTGIEKSFGVLIPTLVERLDSDYATIGLICSMHSTMMYLACPFVTLALRRVSHRSVAMPGGLLSALCFIACAFLKSTVTVGICLALSGVGMAMTYLPTILALNDFFKDKFVLWSTVASYGYTSGSLLLPILTERSLPAYGYQGEFIIFGGVALHLLVCGATLRKATDRSVSGTSERGGRDQEKSHIEVTSHQRDEKVEARDVSLLEWVDKEQEDENCEETLPEKRCLIQQETNVQRNQKTLPNDSPGDCGIFNEWIFLLSLATLFLFPYATYAWMLFLVPHAEHLGISPSNAVYLSTLGGIGGILGRTTLITLISKGVSDLSVYIVVGSICSGSFFLDFIISAYPVRATLAFIQGFSFFIEDSVLTSLCKAAIFHEKNFDMAVAIANFTGGLGISCAGIFTDYLIDVTESFTKVFIIIGAIHAIAVIDLIIVCFLIKRRQKDIQTK
ncbi:monocarboxylate transporter 7-like [Lytechinus variegatus]|uniref:monocarboxylate transporter 7-like n=1 Tax=Lytechinus variegatus TaxID=7654 RepID=UPI001BB1DD76|nr:monocarboxylate transporter 7-like [Lytechinus variegatus]